MNVIHIRNWDKSNKDHIYIGRGSIWGNPFIIGTHGDRTEVIRMFKLWAERNGLKDAAKANLKGKTLVCYCAPQACHGDILLEWANS